MVTVKFFRAIAIELIRQVTTARLTIPGQAVHSRRNVAFSDTYRLTRSFMGLCHYAAPGRKITPASIGANRSANGGWVNRLPWLSRGVPLLAELLLLY